MENIKKLFKKNYEKNSILFELTVGLYLLQCDYRNIFQLWYSVDNNKTPLKTITDIIMSTKFDYIEKKKNESTIIFIIYNKNTFNIDELNKTDGKKYAKQLGKFYKCSIDGEEYLGYEHRITINAFNYTKMKNSCEIYAQICKKESISKNINLFLEISGELKLLLLKLDKSLSVEVNIEIIK
jgi:hypothetical protein